MTVAQIDVDFILRSPQLIDWLIDFIDRLLDHSFPRLIDWLIESLRHWLIDWWDHYDIDWLIDWLIDWCEFNDGRQQYVGYSKCNRFEWKKLTNRFTSQGQLTENDKAPQTKSMRTRTGGKAWNSAEIKGWSVSLDGPAKTVTRKLSGNPLWEVGRRSEMLSANDLITGCGAPSTLVTLTPQPESSSPYFAVSAAAT